MTTTKELIEWLNAKCALTRGRYRGHYAALRARLEAAERMREAIRFTDKAFCPSTYDEVDACAKLSVAAAAYDVAGEGKP